MKSDFNWRQILQTIASSIKFLVLMLFNSLALANTCDLSTDYDYTVDFSVAGYLFPDKEVLSIQSNPNIGSTDALWRASDKNSSDALFHSTPISFDGWFSDYYKIEYTKSTNQISLYRWEWFPWGWVEQSRTAANYTAHYIELEAKDKFKQDSWQFDNFSCEQDIPTASVPDIEFCKYFPEPVQAWSSSSNFLLSSSTADQITGFSDEFKDRYKTTVIKNSHPTDALMLGFGSGSTNSRKMSCQYGMCAAFDQSKTKYPIPLAPVPLEIEPGFNSSVSLDIRFDSNDKHPSTVCAANPDKCSYSNSTGELTIKGNVNTLTVTKYGSGQGVVKFEPPANQPLSIRTYLSEGKVTSKFLANGTYIFDTYNTKSSGARMETGENVVLAIMTSMSSTNNTEHSDTGNQNDLLIYGPTASISMKIKNGTVFSGYILADSVEFNTPVTVKGGITTLDLHFHNQSKIIGGGYCSNPPSNDDYTLVVSPEKQTALTCESPQVQFTTLNENGVGAALPSGTVVNVTHTADNLTLVSGKGSASGSGYLSNANGELWFTVSNASIEDGVQVTGMLNPIGESESATSSIDFVPYAFVSEPMNIVAGYPTPTKVSVASCNGSNSTTVKEYETSPTATISINQPQDGVIGAFAYSPTFKQGESNSTLRLEQVGNYTVRLVDPSFECSDLAGCPEEGYDTLAGHIDVTSKPWRFEVCDANGDSVDGTSKSGDKYKVAGEEFNLVARPMAYRTQPFLCDASAITTNYWLPHDGYPNASIALSQTLHTPDAGVSGVLSSEDGLDRPIHPQAIDVFPQSVIEGQFTNLKYNEAGSMLLSAVDTASFYTSLTAYIGTQPSTGVLGERAIGRFIPAYIEITDTQWNYPSLHHGFAYMGQPLDHRFTVKAFNAESPAKETQNYGLFNDPYIVDIAYRAYDSSGDSMLARIEDQSQSAMAMAQSSFLTWSGGDWNMAGLDVQISEFVFNKKVNSANIKATVPDGPINQRFALEVTNAVDGVDFSTPETTLLEADLTSQPLFRYGRATLKDTSGSTGTETRIPLTAQYWNGSRFVANGSDDGSDYAGASYCVKTHWRSDSALTAASMQNNGQVDQGHDDQLTVAQNAIHSSNVREQSRFWLRLGSETDSELLSDYQAERCSGNKGSRPWLQYDWNNTGDQDPSTLVTFGTYRGNDRVIFRGEPGLTGF